MAYKDFNDLVKAAENNGFHVTSTNGGAHNVGSKHYLGLAIDVRTRDKTAKQISDFVNLLRNEGLIVRDERIPPPRQRVWNGSHLHIEIASDRASNINRDTILKVGSKGEAVKTLQNRLAKLGFLEPEDVDGDFGSITENGVIAFQKFYNIAVDGKVGTETKSKLAEVLAGQSANPTAPQEIMGLRITPEQLNRIAPNARANYREAFAQADTVLAQYDINKNGLRLSHFMAQVLHEVSGLTILIENMNYRAERIVQVWSTRFPTVASAEPYAHNPEKLANKVYGGRMGNVQPGDGWRFIGRGMIQITGRESYEKFGNRLGVDLISNPDLAFSAEWALKIAAEEWKASNCNAFADEDNLRKVTKAINGGLIGLASRQEWLTKAKKIWLP